MAPDPFVTADGLTLLRRQWLPAGTASGVVVMIHGFTEHSGRYAELAGELNLAGLAMETLDLRGHGRSDGRRAWIVEFDDFLSDLDQYHGLLRSEWAKVPLFLLGHSMGGLVAARWASLRPEAVEGVILSAPALAPGKAVFPWLRQLAPLVGFFFPRLRLAAMGSSRLSRDPAVVQAFRDDPLVVHDRFPLRSGTEMLRAMRQVFRNSRRLTSPLLVLHGTGDVVTAPEGSQALLALAGSTDKTIKLYEGLYHDLFHEPERRQVTADLIDWLKARIAPHE